MLRLFGIVIGLLFLLLLARFIHLSMTAQPPDSLASNTGHLAPCPDSPNCISSLAERKSQHVEPLIVKGDPASALKRVTSAVESMSRTRVVTASDGYVHAEFTSGLFRFVDDLELVYDPDLPGFQVRSASRIGYYDMGTNRKRVEELRTLVD